MPVVHECTNNWHIYGRQLRGSRWSSAQSGCRPILPPTPPPPPLPSGGSLKPRLLGLSLRLVIAGIDYLRLCQLAGTLRAVEVFSDRWRGKGGEVNS